MAAYIQNKWEYYTNSWWPADPKDIDPIYFLGHIILSQFDGEHTQLRLYGRKVQRQKPENYQYGINFLGVIRTLEGPGASKQCFGGVDYMIQRVGAWHNAQDQDSTDIRDFLDLLSRSFSSRIGPHYKEKKDDITPEAVKNWIKTINEVKNRRTELNETDECYSKIKNLWSTANIKLFNDNIAQGQYRAAHEILKDKEVELDKICPST